MKAVDAATLIENLSWRYAVKKFDATKKIPNETFQALEKALVLSPSSYGLQPWKFLVVETPSVREKLKAVAWNQTQITDASHLIVLCHREDMGVAEVDEYVADIAATRGVTKESIEGYRQMMVGTLVPPKFDIPTWTSRQVYIALGVLLTSSAHLGVDACPMEGFDAGQFDEILGLKGTGYKSVVCCTLGYRAQDDGYQHAKKVRFSAEKLIERR